MPRIPHEQLPDRRPGEPSASIRERVERAREIQATRYAGTAVRQMGLSARAYHRVLILARTIADLAGEEHISTAFVAEALQYRPRVAEG